MVHVMRVDLSKEHEKISAPLECQENMPNSLILLLTRPHVNYTQNEPFAELMEQVPVLRVETDAFCNRYNTQPGHCLCKKFPYWNEEMHVAVGLIGDPEMIEDQKWGAKECNNLYEQAANIGSIIGDYCASHGVNSVYFPWNGIFLKKNDLAKDADDREDSYKFLSIHVAEQIAAQLPYGVAFYHVMPTGFDIRPKGDTTFSCC